MSMAAIQPVLPSTSVRAEAIGVGGAMGDQSRFGPVLSMLMQDPDDPAAATEVADRRAAVSARLIEAGHEDIVQVAEQAAEQLVASSFVVPLLAAMRDSPFQTEMFGTTMAERRIGPVFDQMLADRIVQCSNFSLVEGVKTSILEKQARLMGVPEADAGSVIDAQG